MPGTIPPEIVKALAAGRPPPADLGPDEKRAYEQVAFFYKNGLGYANEMALRPQTLYGIVDSPAGLAAWILDHDADSSTTGLLPNRVLESERALPSALRSTWRRPWA